MRAGTAALVTVLPRLVTRLRVRPPLQPGLGRAIGAAVLLGALWQPVLAGAVSFSRRISRPTHDLAEAWIREHADPGTVVLVERGWLDFGRTPITPATRSLASSTARRARRPEAWRLDGLPCTSVRYGSIAASTSGSSGVVAAWSR